MDDRDARTTWCEEVVTRVREGDPAAWQELVDEFTPMMRRTAMSFRLGDADCSDVVQTVWMRLIEHLDTIRDGKRIAGWLATTTRRECLRVLRRREVPAEHWALDHADRMEGPDQLVLDAEEVSLVREALTRLPERDQHLLSLVIVPSPDYTAVSESLGMPHGSIGPTRARALHRLRREMERTPAGPLPVIPKQRQPLPAA
jgi:RNA polymerase sigma factor (sigma-70 family)